MKLSDTIIERFGKLLTLRLFGEGGGDGAGAGDGGADPGMTDPDETEDAEAAAPDADAADAAEEGQELSDAQPDPEADRRARYAEFKKEFQADIERDMKRALDKRMRAHAGDRKELEELRPIADYLKTAFGVKTPAEIMQKLDEDDGMIADRAAEMGMTPEAFRKYADADRRARAAEVDEEQRRQAEYLELLDREIEETKAQYPDFDFDLEMQNEEFGRLMKAGVPMAHAYQVMHINDTVTGVAQQALRTGAARAIESKRQRQSRPAELAGGSRSPAQANKFDVAGMTVEKAEELERRAMRGEIITL